MLGSQHVAGSADVEVLHGNMNAASQFREAFDSLQPAACLLGERTQWRRKEITERLAIASSYAAAKLVQVGETKLLCIVNNNGIGIGYVDAAFDNARCHQYVVFVVYEIEDFLLQFVWIHLSVGDTDAGIGHFAAHQRFYLVDILDAVVDEEHLPVATHLKVDGFADNIWVETFHFGLHGITV